MENSRSSDGCQLLRNLLFFLLFLYLYFVGIELLGEASKGFGAGLQVLLGIADYMMSLKSESIN